MVQPRSHNVFPAESCPQDDGPPVQKRRRVGTATKKQQPDQKHRAKLLLSFDELYIVFAYVYPMDLLNLARTCKYLRNILMHKSSQLLWKVALHRVEGLPDCPSDLTEPQYTNLVFYNYCHGCNKPTTAILWQLRLRYCPDCKYDRLSYIVYCDRKLRCILPCLKAEKKTDDMEMFDKEQERRLSSEYHSSINKEQFVAEKRQEYLMILSHASECAKWRRQQGRVKRFDLEILRKERGESILERLGQHGYGPEIAYFRDGSIKKAYQLVFKSRKRLTDPEWDQIWPKCVDIMDKFRLKRLDQTCYDARRKLLISEYDKYVRCQTPDTPAFDLLPHVVDLACFSPFQNIIEAPEEAQMGEEPFASAFAQLPALLPEWKNQLDVRLARLVIIPSHLTQQDAPSGQVMESSNTTSQQPYPMDFAKLRLACALFESGGTDCSWQLFAYPKVLLAPMLYETYPLNYEATRMRDESTDNFMICLFEEAPYIVHACGLDPNVATTDDMDRRNARLRCLACKSQRVIVMNWRDAMLHARVNHDLSNDSLLPLSESPRWQVIGDDHIEAIEVVEKSVESERPRNSMRRCLLCQPRVGDGFSADFEDHMQECHGVNERDIEQGHYEFLGLEGNWLPNKVEMVEEGGQVIFRRPSADIELPMV
ncbi:hypothetical protein JVU11DRAFT_7450 [Chiua virens]|nr:hypothetical protein JVU11DRAFT_7450 [Chiua virens]